MSVILQLENIEKKFGDLEILSEINFALNSGKSLAIMGRSGSGKSTLLNLIAGLDIPTSGKVSIDGVDISGLSEDTLAKLRGEHIGFVFQSFRLLESLTAIENICLPLELLEKEHSLQTAMTWLERLGLKTKAHQFPSSLSGGEQQRVALARALVHSPRILIADEPTGNLDHRTSEEVGELILQYCKTYKIALVIATHDQNIAQKADSVVELYQGKLQLIK